MVSNSYPVIPNLSTLTFTSLILPILKSIKMPCLLSRTDYTISRHIAMQIGTPKSEILSETARCCHYSNFVAWVVPLSSKLGGIAWKSVCQEHTSLSSCEAEIRATNEGTNITIALRNLADGFADCGVTLTNAKGPTLVYNDNQSCVCWSHNQTMKHTRHMELRDNSVHKWIQYNIITVKHVAGKHNPRDFFH